MAVFEIPLTPEPQVFSISLGESEYQLTVLYRDIDQGGWFLDIANSSGVNMICGIPLVTGCDLLAQYAYLNFGGKLEVQTDNDPDKIPTFDNLGLGSHLYFVTS